MAVKHMREFGPVLQKVVTRIFENQNLMKLLYYTNDNPLAQPDISMTTIKKDMFHKLIKIVPRVLEDEIKTGQSLIAFNLQNGTIDYSNSEYFLLHLQVVILCPLDKWVIQDDNLRPFAIMGEIQKSLDQKQVNGLGTLDFEGFSNVSLTDEVAGYTMSFGVHTFR